jgi:hypothetical protein
MENVQQEFDRQIRQQLETVVKKLRDLQAEHRRSYNDKIVADEEVLSYYGQEWLTRPLSQEQLHAHSHVQKQHQEEQPLKFKRACNIVIQGRTTQQSQRHEQSVRYVTRERTSTQPFPSNTCVNESKNAAIGTNDHRGSPTPQEDATQILSNIHERARLYDQALFVLKRRWRNRVKSESGEGRKIMTHDTTIEAVNVIAYRSEIRCIVQLNQLSLSLMEIVLEEFRLLKQIQLVDKFDEVIPGYVAAIRLAGIILHDKQSCPPINFVVQFYHNILSLLQHANS